MIQEVRLPRLGKAMSQATIVSLKVGVNQTVDRGQILCDLETDKATLELESPAAGTVKHIFCTQEQTLPVLTPLFIVADAGEAIPADSLKKLQDEFTSLRISLEHTAAQTLSAGNPVFLTAESESKRELLRNGKKIPMTRRQRVIADKMLASKQRIPCFYLNIRVDVTELIEILDKLNQSVPEKYSVNDFIMRALAAGMKHYPIMTGWLGEDCIVLSPTMDIGLVVAAPGGPVSPVMRDVGSKTLEEISVCRHDLIHLAIADKLTIDDLTGGSIAVSNLGKSGIDSFIPIVVPGQCSILGVGRIAESPVPSGKENIVIRKMMNLNLSVDHRIANGADAAQFLDFVKKQLEHPDELRDQSAAKEPA